MSDTSRKPKAIMLVDFQEEVLPAGRKLLECIFQDGHSTWRYRWTPPWRDTDREKGFERMLLKVLEVEEWNDPKGPWDEELKKAAEEVPMLRDFRLPAQVQCGTLTAVSEEGWAYRFEVSIIGDEYGQVEHDTRDDSFRVGQCQISYQQFKSEFLAVFGQTRGLTISQESRGLWEDGFDPPPVGVAFTVRLPRGMDRQIYRIVGREIASFVRSYLRRVLGDYESLKRGFED